MSYPRGSFFRTLRESYAAPPVTSYFAAQADDGWTDDEASVVRRLVTPGQSMLLVGGGGGRDARAWARHGNRVMVADLTFEMVELARRTASTANGAAARFVTANAVELPFRRAAFDHVVFGDSVYEQIPGGRNRQRALREAAALLDGGFLFVYCGWIGASPRIPTGELFQKLRVVRQWLAGNFSAREPGDARIRRLVPADTSTRWHFWHFFRSPDEIAAELAGAGMTIEARIGGIWALRPLESG